MTDAILGPTNNVLNALASVRYRFVELGLDVYNVLGLQVPGRRGVLRVQLEPEVRVSSPRRAPCTSWRRRRARPLATLSLYF